ncbi:hypothetical protein [Candidatus Nitrospira nitrificans]|uniref:Secreted protein n=1 Tax=Candidatus Nitrospira nitrificans TaxID=1742973 RepID=A0A0S4LKN7_9BACT|nr:hypothetical protein [Candidatus Nitrospira nitrificans]CUS38069.1 exported hypothetical protein [Candidatus Nitrospira nitrificans]
MKWQIFMGVALTAPSYVFAAGNTVPIDVTVDTGSHTCTSIGQDHRAYRDIYAGDGRYFFKEQLAEKTKFGAGNCEYNSDGGGNAYETRSFCVTDADGEKECSQRLVRVIVRAYADCTNNPGKLTSRVGTECRFTATSKKGNPQ